MLLQLNHRAFFIYFWVIIAGFASCNDKSTAPIDELVLPEILGIEVLPDDAETGDTLSFRLILSNVESQAAFQVSWQIEDLQGEITDTLTQETELQWIAPSDTGTYHHSVQLIAEGNQSQSALSSFSVRVGIRINPHEMIVFSGYEPSEFIYHIYSYKVSTGELSQLTDFDKSSIHPAWNPYGTAIAFASNYHPIYIWPDFSIWIIDQNGENPIQLLDENNYEVLGFLPDWSPDGENIALEFCPSCEVGLHNYSIYNYNISSKNLEKVVENNFPNNNPTWNSEGDQMAYISGRDYVSEDTLRWRTDLYISSLSTGESRRITNTGNILSPVWNPVQSKIAVRVNAFEETGIYLVDIGSGEKELLIEDSSENVRFYPYAWHPDGKQLLVGESDTSKGITKLYKFNIETSVLVEVLTWGAGGTSDSILGADWYVPD